MSDENRRHTDGPMKPLTPQQRKIADGIHRGLSYAEIGLELGISPSTVKQHVRMMALLFDNEDCLPPRWRIFMWIEYEYWVATHAAKLPKPA